MLCHFSHPRACKLFFGLGIPLTSLSLYEVPSSEQSAVLGLRAILGYKMEAPGTREPNQKNCFKFRRLLSQFLVKNGGPPIRANPTQKQVQV